MNALAVLSKADLLGTEGDPLETARALAARQAEQVTNEVATVIKGKRGDNPSGLGNLTGLISVCYETISVIGCGKS